MHTLKKRKYFTYLAITKNLNNLCTRCFIGLGFYEMQFLKK